MAISDAINSIKTHLTEAWNAVHEKGGASAGNDNLENLAPAIAALSGGAEIDFKSHPDAYIGIAGLTPTGEYEVAYLTDSAAVEAMCSDEGYDFTTLGFTPVKIAFSELVQSLDITSIGNNFLKYAGPGDDLWGRPTLSLVSIDGLENFIKVTTVGNDFIHEENRGMGGDRPLTLQHFSGFPPNITTTGDYFFSDHPSFNEPLTLPARLETLGIYSLTHLEAYNHPTVLPVGLTTIPQYSFNYWSSFNSSLTLPPNLQAIGDNFLVFFEVFNQPLTLPETLQTIGNFFLVNTSAFNQPLTLPETLQTIGNFFLGNASAFNQPLVIPEGVQSIGDSFLRNASTFTQPLTIPASVTSIGDNMMMRAANFTGPLTINTTVVPASNNGNGSLSTDTETDPMFAIGVTVEGVGADAWRTALPAKYENYNYRYLVGQERPGPYLKYVMNGASEYSVTDAAAAVQFLSGEKPERMTSMTIYPKCATLALSSLDRFCTSHQNVVSIEGLENLTQVTTIGDDFCDNCPNLTTISGLPPNVTTIGENFLAYSDAFNAPLSFPDTVTTIGPTCMVSCSAFNSPLHLPASLTTLGAYSFEDLTSFDQQLILPDNLENIPTQCFCRLNAYTGANGDCHLPSNLKTIVKGCFTDWTQYAGSLTIPTTLESMGNDNFSGWGNFTGPVTVNNYSPTFTGTFGQDSVIAVNLATVPAYQSGVRLRGARAAEWKNALPNKSSGYYRNLIVDTSD